MMYSSYEKLTSLSVNDNFAPITKPWWQKIKKGIVITLIATSIIVTATLLGTLLGGRKPVLQGTKKSLLSSCGSIPGFVAPPMDGKDNVIFINITRLGTIKIYCDVVTENGSWIVFQRRVDGTIDFFRNWTQYVSGFGDVSHEFWLGLDVLHELTRNNDQELRIDMTVNNGTHLYATYSYFMVGDASDNYRLNVTGYSGNATDSFENPDGIYADLHDQQFSTFDADHDTWRRGNCAKERTGAWWYRHCLDSNLNGIYGNRTRGGLFWRDQERERDMYIEYVEMKIRKRT